jgi:hypothetical protein
MEWSFDSLLHMLTRSKFMSQSILGRAHEQVSESECSPTYAAPLMQPHLCSPTYAAPLMLPHFCCPTSAAPLLLPHFADTNTVNSGTTYAARRGN